MVVDLLKRIFTWWNGQTVGTWLYTKRKGVSVGSDSQGNQYYRTNADKPRDERRWVIYNGESEASRIPPEWHLWIHHITNDTPDKAILSNQEWQKPHHENLTGTNQGYAPESSLMRQEGHRPKATGDYEAWSPEN